METDVVLELYNSSQTLVASSNPLADTNASISTSVSAGTYHVVVKPTAAGSPLTSSPSGYTLYGSLGYYTISGTYSAVDSIFLTAPNGGESWLSGASSEITWASGVGGNVKIELLKGGALHTTISSSTPNDGSFSWAIPSAQTSASDYKIRLTSLTNPSISVESQSNFSIVPDLLAAALDTTGYTWPTTGNATWFSQSAVTYDGADSAQSGVITHNQSSSVETTLTGPGTMTFWWKVSSESGYDFLRFYINNVEQTGSLARIAGNVDWVQKTVSIPSGSQTVKWSYTKDGSVDAGFDAGWVDQVVFTPASSEGSLAVTPAGGLSASGTYGGAFSPSSLQYTLSNPGSTAINWTAAKTQAWVSLRATGGTLAAGASTTVAVSLNASSLNVGGYSDTVTFTNTTNGTGNTTRSVSLTVSKASQTISFAALDPVLDNTAPFALTATASSGLAAPVQGTLLIVVNQELVGAVVFSDNFEPGSNSFGGTTPDVASYTVANTSQQANTNLWVRATSGFNAGTSYNAMLVLFDSGAARNAVETANKDTSAVLAQSAGNAINNGSYQRLTLRYVVGDNVVDNNGAASGGGTQFLPELIGKDIALRFAGVTSSANIDNVQVSVSQAGTANNAPLWANAPIQETDAHCPKPYLHT